VVEAMEVLFDVHSVIGFDREKKGEREGSTYRRDPVWSRPMLLTLLRRFLSAAKAEL
jgi:hypothetical protein